MIDLLTNQRTFQGKIEKIVEWKIWWMTPKGLVETLEEARNVSKQLDMDINAICVPVVVAVTATSYEIFSR
jgi:hypothetical protein